MIKAGIYGDPDATGRDLVRLLINHPDVELISFVSEKHAGPALDRIIPDLIGEIDLRLTGTLDLSKINVLFCDGTDGVPGAVIDKLRADKDFRLIIIGGAAQIPRLGEDDADDTSAIIYGLPEINRKAMVRGARAAVSPDPLAHALLLAVFPLAKNLLLNSGIEADIVSSLDITPDFNAEVKDCLRSVQSSFNSDVTVKSHTMQAGKQRVSSVTVRVDCAVDMGHLREIYAGAYSDHNFTFILPEHHPADAADIARTNKCLLSLDRCSDGRLEICAVIDNRLKGAAGNAVHIMNLLFGLHERTGLALFGGSELQEGRIVLE